MAYWELKQEGIDGACHPGGVKDLLEVSVKVGLERQAQAERDEIA